MGFHTLDMLGVCGESQCNQHIFLWSLGICFFPGAEKLAISVLCCASSVSFEEGT